MLIRSATEHDLVQIKDLWNAMIRDTTSTFTSVEKTLNDMVSLLGEREESFLVAVQGKRVAGFITWGPFRAGPGYVHTAEHSIIIAHPAQGTGRALMQAALARAQTQDIHIMIAGIGHENQAAVAFHTAMGFASVGRLPQVGRKSGRWHDLILMSRSTATT